MNGINSSMALRSIGAVHNIAMMEGTSCTQNIAMNEVTHVNAEILQSESRNNK